MSVLHQATSFFAEGKLKGSYMFLVFMIPILVVVFVIVALVTRLFDY